LPRQGVGYNENGDGNTAHVPAVPGLYPEQRPRLPVLRDEGGARAVDRRQPGEILGGLIPHTHFTTAMILLINFGLFAATVIYGMRAGHADALWGIDGLTLFAFGAKYREAMVLDGQWWRLVTAGFLHGGLLHIAMNSWVLFDLGAQVEESYGSSRFLVFYFVSTVFGFLASFWFSNSLSVGASAGLMGLIGAMIALGVRGESRTGRRCGGNMCAGRSIACCSG